MKANFVPELDNTYSSPDDLYHKLINNILNTNCTIQCPNEKWGIHKCFQTKSIIFYYMEMVPTSEDENILLPKCSKQVNNFFDSTVYTFLL